MGAVGLFSYSCCCLAPNTTVEAAFRHPVNCGDHTWWIAAQFIQMAQCPFDGLIVGLAGPVAVRSYSRKLDYVPSEDQLPFNFSRCLIFALTSVA